MDQIRTLLWLRLRFSLALYRKRRSLLVSLLLTLPMTLAFNLGLFFAGLVAFWSLPLELSRQLMSGALTAIYITWLMGPLLGVSLNEGYDISKLLVFPVSGRTIFTANILGSVFDPPVLLLLVPLASIPVGLATGWLTAALIVAVLLVFLFHTISLSQALLTLLWGLLKSRRVADFWKVFVALAGTIFWVGYQVAIRRVSNVAPALVTARPGRYTWFLPSGLTADAVAALHAGDMAAYAWRMGILCAICAATIALAGGLVQRVAAGDLVLDRVGLAPKERIRRPRSTRRMPAWLSATTMAMFQNELRIYVRDPQVKAELLRQAGGLIAMPLIMLSSSHGSITVEDMQRVGPLLFLAPMGTMVLLMLAMSSNSLAKDRHGLSLLFAMPAPRTSILAGKNAAMLLVFSPVGILITLVIAAVIRQWALVLPAIVVTECLMLMSIAEGNLFSVYNPTPLAEKGRNPYTSGRGCSLVGCAGSVAAFILFLFLAAPLVPAFLAPARWISPRWFAVTLPTSAAYAGAIYWLITNLAAKGLVKREPEVLEVVLKMPA